MEDSKSPTVSKTPAAPSKTASSAQPSPLPPSGPPNHSRRFSRSGFNLGITIDNTPSSAHPLPDPARITLPVIRGHVQRLLSSTVNLPVYPRHSVTSARLMLASSLMTLIAEKDDPTDKLRALALKEMRVVELRDEIRSLKTLLEAEMRDLHVMRQQVLKELHSMQLPVLKKSPEKEKKEEAGKEDDKKDQDKEDNDTTPVASKRMSSMWDSILKPLNLFSQFDTMLQSEFEKISSGTGTSHSRGRSEELADSTIEEREDDFFSWEDSTPSKPSKTKDDPIETTAVELPKTVSPKVPTRARKGSLVLSEGVSGKNGEKSVGLKLSRNPSYRKSINMSEHKIILPKRNNGANKGGVVSPQNKDFKGLFDKAKPEPKNISKPILSLAGLPKKESLLLSVGSSIWNFYEDVKDGLMLSVEEEAQKGYTHKNLSIDNLIDLDSSPEKYKS